LDPTVKGPGYECGVSLLAEKTEDKAENCKCDAYARRAGIAAKRPAGDPGGTHLIFDRGVKRTFKNTTARVKHSLRREGAKI